MVLDRKSLVRIMHNLGLILIVLSTGVVYYIKPFLTLEDIGNIVKLVRDKTLSSGWMVNSTFY